MGIFVGKVECRRRLGRWEDYITLDLKEMGWEVVDWIHLV
jgi:hypothetical protein